ncbi:MAG: hypothetical protein ACOX9R_17650 [Armatimonadota bacterium]|jgi:hypothetical protein
MSETSPANPQLSRRRAIIIAQAALVVLLAAWLLIVQRDIGRPGEWIVAVLGPVYPVSYLLPPLLTLLGFGGLLAHLWRSMRREKIDSHRRALAWTIAIGLAVGAWSLQVALWSVAPGSVPRLAAVQLSEVSTGYLGEAFTIRDVGDYLRRYADEMPRKPEHVATHPPGAVLFFYAVRQIGDAFPELRRSALIASSTAVGLSIEELGAEVVAFPTTRWLGSEGLATAIIASWLLGAAGALMPVVLFAALRAPVGAERALAAAAVLALTPSMLFYFPTLVMLMALASTLLVAALAAAQRHFAWSAVAGLIAAAALFVSLGAMALVALAGVFLLLRAARQVGQSGDASWSDTRSAAVPLLAFGGGLLAGLALWYAAGVDALEVFSQGLGAHSSITGLASFRSYGLWVWMNLVEFAIFMGLPLVALAAAAIPRMVRTLRETSSSALPAYLGAAALLTLLMLDISGVVRGETGRLWLFFVPWLAAAAAPDLVDEGGGRWRLLAFTCALTALQLLLMAWTMQPIVRPY